MKITKFQIERLKKLAISSGKKGNLPNGALIISKNGTIITSSESLVATSTDATAHAERLVVEKACKKEKSPVIRQYDLITILEPCLMCISAAYWAGIKNVYFIVPAFRYFNQLPWITESKTINKKSLINNFEEKMNYRHLKKYEEEFVKIFNQFLKKVIDR